MKLFSLCVHMIQVHTIGRTITSQKHVILDILKSVGLWKNFKRSKFWIFQRSGKRKLRLFSPFTRHYLGPAYFPYVQVVQEYYTHVLLILEYQLFVLWAFHHNHYACTCKMKSIIFSARIEIHKTFCISLTIKMISISNFLTSLSYSLDFKLYKFNFMLLSVID